MNEMPELPTFSPELALVFEVIRRAVVDAVQGQIAHPRSDMHRYGREAAAWLRSPATHSFSFLWCCEQLDIEPTAILRFSKEADPHTDFLVFRKQRQGSALYAVLSLDEPTRYLSPSRGGR